MDAAYARTLNLADFWQGHDDDPLAPPPEFVAWRAATVREQSIFQRPLASASGPRTILPIEGKERRVVNLASLDYLGLNGDPRLVRAAKEALEVGGTGACGVPLLSGPCFLDRRASSTWLLPMLTKGMCRILFPEWSKRKSCQRSSRTCPARRIPRNRPLGIFSETGEEASQRLTSLPG